MLVHIIADPTHVVIDIGLTVLFLISCLSLHYELV